MRVTRFLGAGLLALIAVGAGSGLLAAPTSGRAKLSINDNFPGTQVLSDGAGSTQPNLYTDHNLPGGDPCVTAWVRTTDGFAFINMNYQDDVGGNCSAQLGVTARTYHLSFPESSGVCTLFGVVVDPATAMCTLSGHEAPRVRAPELFKRKGQSTPLAFLFRFGGASYEVRVDQEAPFTVEGNTRTVTYFGTATLWQLTSQQPSPKAASSSFTFTFELSIEGVPQ